MAHVLIIGHDPARATAAQARCRADGHTAAIARHGTEAIVYLARRPVDAVLVDPHMPGREATALIQALRANPAHAGLPVHGLPAETGAPLSLRL